MTDTCRYIHTYGRCGDRADTFVSPEVVAIVNAHWQRCVEFQIPSRKAHVAASQMCKMHVDNVMYVADNLAKQAP